MNIRTSVLAIVIGMLPGLGDAASLVESATSEEREWRAAFVAAYVDACQPVEYDFGGARESLSSTAVAVRDEIFTRIYGGSCRDFYFNEVVRRLEVDQQPYFIPAAR
jgi:hypothetical protein